MKNDDTTRPVGAAITPYPTSPNEEPQREQHSAESAPPVQPIHRPLPSEPIHAPIPETPETPPTPEKPGMPEAPPGSVGASGVGSNETPHCG